MIRKWLYLHILVFIVIIILPWTVTLWKYFRINVLEINNPAITSFITTPSGDQFVYINPDTDCWPRDVLLPASVRSYGYKLSIYGHAGNVDDQPDEPRVAQYGDQPNEPRVPQLGDKPDGSRMKPFRAPDPKYVDKPTTFRIVKNGIVGRTHNGYYIINTTHREAFVYPTKQDWHAALTTMGVPHNIRCYPLPVRQNYDKRRWLKYQPD